jgi:hypothetical protein
MGKFLLSRTVCPRLGASDYARCPRTEVSRETMLEPARMIDSRLREPDPGMKRVLPKQLFEQITDILADMLLQDIQRFPGLPAESIDTRRRYRNTLRPQR